MILFFRDPVTIKELSGVARRWQTYASRMAYLGFIGLVLYQFWQTTLRRTLATAFARSEWAQIGRSLFFGMVTLQLIFVALQSISAASDLVTKELRAGTLGVLGATPLSPFMIAVGKWKAAMAQVAALLLSGLPVMAISVYLGGVGPWDLGWSLSVSLALGMMGAALSLYCSSLFRSGTTALIVALAIYLAYAVVPGILLSRDLSVGALRDLSYVHPVYSAVISSGSYQSRGSPRYEYGWITATLTSGAVAWILLRGTAARIGVLSQAAPKPALLTRTMEAMDRFYEGLGPRSLRNIRLLGDGGHVWETQALLWKELRTRATGKLRHATRLSLGLLILVFAPASLLFSDWPALYAVLFALTAILLLVLGLASGVSLFVKEKEERKWDLLLSTPLGTGEILRGKLLSGLVSLGPAAVFLLFLLGMLSWFFRVGWMGTWMALIAVALPVGLGYVLGASASLRFRSLQAAFSASFGVLGVLLLGVPVILAVYANSTNVPWDDDRSLFLLYSISHPAKFLIPFFNRISSSSGDFWLGQNYPFDKNLGYFVCFCMLYLLAIGQSLLWMRLGFGRLTGRSGS